MEYEPDDEIFICLHCGNHSSFVELQKSLEVVERVVRIDEFGDEEETLSVRSETEEMLESAMQCVDCGSSDCEHMSAGEAYKEFLERKDEWTNFNESQFEKVKQQINPEKPKKITLAKAQKNIWEGCKK